MPPPRGRPRAHGNFAMQFHILSDNRTYGTTRANVLTPQRAHLRFRLCVMLTRTESRRVSLRQFSLGGLGSSIWSWDCAAATRADVFAIDVLAGAMLVAADTKDPATLEVWRKRGAAFFQSAIRIRGECPGLSTSVKVHPDGTGAPKKRDRKPSAVNRPAILTPFGADRPDPRPRSHGCRGARRCRGANSASG
jgi:hypothetical protein